MGPAPHQTPMPPSQSSATQGILGDNITLSTNLMKLSRSCLTPAQKTHLERQLAQLSRRDGDSAVLQDAATTATALAMVGRGGTPGATAALAPLVLPASALSSHHPEPDSIVVAGAVATAKLATVVLGWVIQAEAAVEGLIGGLSELVEGAVAAAADDNVS